MDNREPKLIHLLNKLRTSLLAKHGGQRVNKNDLTSQNEDWQSYHNVQELQAAGLYLKRSKKVSLRVRLGSGYFAETKMFLLKVL